MMVECQPVTATILAALNEVMAKVGYVQKAGRNEFHRYNYAGEADLLKALRPAMVEAGLILIPSVTAQSEIDQFGNTHVVVEYTLAHKSGEVWPQKIVARGSGNDKNSKGGVGDKGLYKALTGANKYLLFKLFQIETGDDPEATEGDTPPPSNGIKTAKPAAPPPPPVGADAPWAPKLAEIKRRFGAAPNRPALEAIYTDFTDDLAAMPDDARGEAREAYRARLIQITEAAA